MSRRSVPRIHVQPTLNPLLTIAGLARILDWISDGAGWPAATQMRRIGLRHGCDRVWGLLRSRNSCEVSGAIVRRKTTILRERLEDHSLVSVAGVGDGLTAMVAERSGFDALWASGLAISATHAVPDSSILTMSEFLQAAIVTDRASNLPVIADCDTGFGDVHNTVRMVEEYERAGIAGVCIEDKEFPKR